MSVSPLPKSAIARISPSLYEGLIGRADKTETKPKQARDFTNRIKIGAEIFEIEKIKGAKAAILPWERLSRILKDIGSETAAMYKDLRGVVTLKGKYEILAGEKMELILSVAPALALDEAPNRKWPRKKNFDSKADLSELLENLPLTLTPAIWKQGKLELGFLCLFTDGAGNYWFKCSRGFHTALNESLSSVETLIDELGDEVSPERKDIVNQTYRRLSSYLA